MSALAVTDRVSFRRSVRLLATLSIGLWLGSFILPVSAQPVAGVEYETRIFLPDSALSLGVDEAIFTFKLKPGTYDGIWKVTAADLEYLRLKVDDVVPVDGGVFIDEIITNGVIQTTNGRQVSDVIWEFDFFNEADFSEDENYTPSVFDPLSDTYDALIANSGPGEVVAFRNITTPLLEEGDTFYKVEYPAQYYEVVTYGVEDDRSWEAAQLDAMSRGGYLATITSAAENATVYGLLGAGQAWIGGYQDLSSCGDLGGLQLASCGWTWVNGEGPIPLSNQPGYSAWYAGEPNGGGEPDTPEDYLTINLRGQPNWNDSRAIPGSNPTQYVIEYPGTVYVARFTTEEVEEEFEEVEFELELIQRTAIVSSVAARNIPTPIGQGTVFDIPTVEQEGLVVVPGLTNVDVCVAPDPREGFMINGEGRLFKGKGKGKGKGTGLETDERKVVRVFNRKSLRVSDLAGTGTCTGELPNVEPDDPYQTYEALLADINLVYPEDFRGFVGKVDLTPEIDGDLDVEAVWLIVVVVRSTAEFAGPVSVVTYPEELIDYTDTPLDEKPVDFVDDNGEIFAACANPLSFRPLDLGANVPAFGEFPYVEDSLIVKTVQCNRSWSLTGRTTHVVPGRLESSVNFSSTEAVETANLTAQLQGLQGTLSEAYSLCPAPSDQLLLGEYQELLDAATAAFGSADYMGAQEALEYFAMAIDEDFNFVPESGPNAFESCFVPANVPGNLISRGLTGAFTIWDRFLNPGAYAKYELPDQFTGLIPDLRD